MADAKEDLDGGLSLRCRISLHLAPSWLGGFIRLGRGASAPPTEGMSVGTKQGEPQKKSPQIISLVVSRYQKNIQTGEKTYPGCRGVGGGGRHGGRGDSMGGHGGFRTSSPPPGRAKRGRRQRRPAARVASLGTWRRTEAGVPGEKFRFVVVAAALPRISTAPNPHRRPGSERGAPASMAEPTSFLAAIALRGSRRPGPPGARGRGRRVAAAPARPRLGPGARGVVRGWPRSLALGYPRRSHSPGGVSSTVEARSPSPSMAREAANPRSTQAGGRRRSRPPLPLPLLLPPPPPPPRSPQLWAPGGARASRGRGRGAAGSRRT